jgi:hypothetical protein
MARRWRHRESLGIAQATSRREVRFLAGTRMDIDRHSVVLLPFSTMEVEATRTEDDLSEVLFGK